MTNEDDIFRLIVGMEMLNTEIKKSSEYRRSLFVRELSFVMILIGLNIMIFLHAVIFGINIKYIGLAIVIIGIIWQTWQVMS